MKLSSKSLLGWVIVQTVNIFSSTYAFAACMCCYKNGGNISAININISSLSGGLNSNRYMSMCLGENGYTIYGSDGVTALYSYSFCTVVNTYLSSKQMNAYCSGAYNAAGQDSSLYE